MTKVELRLNLKQLMQDKGKTVNTDGSKLKQSQLAELTGIPQGTISGWERGIITRYDKEVIEKLLEYFDCELADLFIVERKRR
jgi:transcriptional regulator with XRE-family HTH domain